MNPFEDFTSQSNRKTVDLSKAATGKTVVLFDDTYYKIENYDAIPPFLMTLVSSSNHWLFISSNGGLSAGRVNSDQALFPYYTEDKITDNNDNTGNKTILRVKRGGQVLVWEPFATNQHGPYEIQRNLYKNISGTVLIFEEINISLKLRFCYSWRTSEKFGFIKTSKIQNNDPLTTDLSIEVLDGLQNILPANIAYATQNNFSCLLDAYKRNEIDLETSLGIFALNSTLTDLAEPSESLLATTVFQIGLPQVNHLLSSTQLDDYRSGKDIHSEVEIRGRRGAYFIHTEVQLPPEKELTWYIVADTHQDAADVVSLQHGLRKKPAELCREIENDIEANTMQLGKILASADALQVSGNILKTAHHSTNVLFNVMRGGIFLDQYWIDTADFKDFVSIHLNAMLQVHAHFLAALPEKILLSDLLARVDAQGSTNLSRLAYTYLPLTFSRRHGDPSRPWNKFSINIKKPDGSVRLDYEGNWRDIFQNWEALAYSFPEYVENMIFTFLNATTVDGFNPYRITRAGVDWEIPEPGNPWANIGYWGDHQIIYLLKLMEISAKVHPGRLDASLTRPFLGYANVPYRIKIYSELLKDPFNTIQFDYELEDEINNRVTIMGTDGKLLLGADGQVVHRSLAEKLLTLLLAKLTNFIPEGGIWMNTQRPEWNDANNALVGKGLSVVTLCYLRRFIVFCKDLFSQASFKELELSHEVIQLFSQVWTILVRFQSSLSVSFDDQQRRAMMDALGQAGSDYRWTTYQKGLSGSLETLSLDELMAFLDLVQRYIEHSLHANKRKDNLYHTYNILHLGDQTASVGHLDEMLEGQVAVLSSGLLSAEESLLLLQGIRESALFTKDQNSYVLYPDKALPGFLAKNTITVEQVRDLQLPKLLCDAQDKTIFVRDIDGLYHFSGQLHNSKDLYDALANLEEQPIYSEIVHSEREKIAALFEDVFHHTEFTGRSGKFFAYEGLGSIYWHMVSKLLLAAQETALQFQNDAAAGQFVRHYYQISAGLGFNKNPGDFGAFPTDPYSHTPKGQGARQPGMTGLVKEEIITRQAELGLVIQNGCLTFTSLLVDPKELLTVPESLHYYDVFENPQHINLEPASLGYTVCAVPVIIQRAEKPIIDIFLSDGSKLSIPGNQLDQINSQHIFQRDGVVHHLVVHLS